MVVDDDQTEGPWIPVEDPNSFGSPPSDDGEIDHTIPPWLQQQIITLANEGVRPRRIRQLLKLPNHVARPSVATIKWVLRQMAPGRA